MRFHFILRQITSQLIYYTMDMKNKLKNIRMQEFMMTKRDFAKFLGILEQQYLRYENGLANPSLEVAILISIKLNRTVNDIWEIETDKI